MQIEDLDKDQFDLNGLPSETQLQQIKQQIQMFNNLIRNEPLSQNQYQQNLLLSDEQWKLQKQIIFDNAFKQYNEKVEKNNEIKNSIRAKLVERVQQSDEEPGKNIMNINENQSKQESIEQNIQRRKIEIEQQLNLEQSYRSKLVYDCEKKFLNLKDFYLKLRDDLLQVPQKKSESRLIEREFLDRQFFIREKPQKKQEQKIEENFQLQIKSEQIQRKRFKHAEFIQNLFVHQSEFLEFHRKRSKNCKKRATHARNFKDYLEKREFDKKDKEQKERVKALKAQDFEAYVDLINDTKNTRILELLTATDKFLKQIGAKILVQKGEAPDQAIDEDLVTSSNDISYLKNSNKVYYNLTHIKKEEIKTQPSLLENGVLKSYQLVGLEWMVSLYNNKLNGVLADEMGLGKTIQTIALFCYLMETKKNYGPFMVVVPLTTLSNWKMEFQRWAPSVKLITYIGPPQHRKILAQQLKSMKWNVTLTTYEYIIKDKNLLHKFQWKYIVVDEGHRMKNSKSKFSTTLGLQYQSEQRLLLTGTPLQNNLSELWSLLNFLLPKVFNSCEDFEKWFSMPITKVGANQEQESQLSEEESLLIINRLHQVLRPFLLRRVKKEVESELPNKLEFVIKVQLSSWQKIVYEQIKDKGFLSNDNSGRFQTKALLNIMMQLRKVCNHPYLFLNQEEYFPISEQIIRSSGKFELLDRMIPKLLFAKHRLLIFSQMTHVMDILQLFFQYKGFQHLRLDGNTKSDERGERMAEFNKKDSPYDIFLLSTRAGGLGLNLQSADTVIIFDSDWNPQMDLQAQDRAHRIGQKNEVRVYRLVTNTVIEEEIFNKAAYKMGLDKLIIQAGLFNQRSTDHERKERLEDLLKNKSYQEELEGDIPDDFMINEMLARNEDELNLYNSIDQNRYQQEKNKFAHFKYPNKSDIKFFNYRLIQDDEVPHWVKAYTMENPIEEVEYGRGNRQKKQVNYNDDYLSDQQWMNNLELQIDSYTHEAVKKKSIQQKSNKKVKLDNSEDQFDLNSADNQDQSQGDEIFQD